jgi:PAS domain S-box-containing protein
MEPFYQVTAILTAGIALAMGLLSFMTFLRRGSEKTDLLFSLMCLLVVLFILFPPVGFILSDQAPYSVQIKTKRIFNFSFIALFPWFIASYTGYAKRLVPVMVTFSIVASYFMMFFTSTESPRQLWFLMAIISVGAMVAHGFYAAYLQFRQQQRTKAIWLFAAVTSFALFNFIGAANQLERNYFSSNWDVIFLPINLCPIVFILIIGLQLQINPNRLTRLEKLLGLREGRWQSLMEDIQLIVVHTDMEGRISFINPYGVRALNYKDASELLDTNWTDHLIPIQETVNSNADFATIKNSGHALLINKSILITKDGKQKFINWTSDLLYNDDDDMIGRMNIGSDITKLEEAIHQIQHLKAELEKENLNPDDSPVGSGHQEIVGNSRPFIYAIQKSRQVAPTNASVLLLGETGVGKEAFADLVQRTSLRSAMPFVKVNCGALYAELIEDELFGHEKGAFTGAVQSRVGRFEKANGGTIFLDEIGELPLPLQPKLLRVLQNGEFERVGGHQTIKVDVRVIAATNADLEKYVKESRFRDDLFYRLNVFPITIPPLRKRSVDIPLLIQHFIENKSKEHGKHFENISKADMNRLCDYEWPGNIRELKNVIERAVISSENHTLRLDWFYKDIDNRNATTTTGTASLEEMEAAYILKVLQECRWKINGENGAAEKLVMHPNTLRSRMKKLKINVPWKVRLAD